MSDQDDPKGEHDEPLAPAGDAADADDDAPSAERDTDAARPRRSGKSGRKARESEEQRAPKVEPKAFTPPVLLALAVALAAGAAGGWFGHDAQAKARLKSESAAAPAGSGVPAGPCGAWQQKICSGIGDESSACSQAKGALDLLTPSTCQAALETVPATLAKVKAERVPCDNLVTKLCAELPPDSAACKMVKERTPAFPRERCTAMLEHLPEVLGQLKQMDQQAPGGMPPGAPHPGGPPMGSPQMAAPH